MMLRSRSCRLRLPILLAGLALPAISLVNANSAWGQDAESGQSSTGSIEYITPKTQAAINRGLAYLARKQIKIGRDRGAFGTSGYGGGVAVSGLAGLAFMCGGSAPGDGPYAKNVELCVDFLMRNTGESGFVAVAQGGRDNMYGHGFATLFLSQAYGMSMRDDVGDKLRKAVDLIERTQNDQGGWRYQPRKADADLSITICQIMALRGARDAGLYVPNETRTRCIDYVKKSQNSDGGFRYMLRSGRSTFPLTAAGVVSLYSAGIYDGEPIRKGLAKIMEQLPSEGSGISGSYFFYGHYYACQAMWYAGGDYWDRWYPAMRELLLRNQNSDGSWTDPHVGPEFGTAMACIILQMPNNYLPIFSK